MLNINKDTKKYKTMVNPYKDKTDPSYISIGRYYWNKSCKSCHGTEGKGDGVRASLLTVPIRDFSLQEFKLQTDGELYYKSIIGHEKMPNFEKVIEAEEDRWLLINYIKTL